jgi:predicted nucleotide-binding protein
MVDRPKFDVLADAPSPLMPTPSPLTPAAPPLGRNKNAAFSAETPIMNVLKEPEHISLAEGLALLESHLSIEQAKTRLREAFIRGVLGESPRFTFEYDKADIDWTTGSVKLPNKPDRFCPSFLRAEFNAYFFEKHDGLAAVSTLAAAPVPLSCKVFLVHGRDNEAKSEVARFLSKIGLEEIILHERPNSGRHLLTKFQEESEGASFAVILITPDDEGGLSGEPPRKRARQNVVFELGFFIGKLGAARVAPLVKGDVEKPSDFDGIGYIALDPNGAWKSLLARELKAAKVPFEAAKVFEA